MLRQRRQLRVREARAILGLNALHGLPLVIVQVGVGIVLLLVLLRGDEQVAHVIRLDVGIHRLLQIGQHVDVVAELPLLVLGVLHHFAELVARAEQAVRQPLALEVRHQAREDGVERAEHGQHRAVHFVGGEARDRRGGQDLDDVDQVDARAADVEPVAGALLLVHRASVVAGIAGGGVVEELPDGLALGPVEELVVEMLAFGAGAAFRFEGVGAEGAGFGGGDARAQDVRVGSDADEVLEDVQVSEVVVSDRVSGERVPVAVVEVRICVDEVVLFLDVVANGVILDVGHGYEGDRTTDREKDCSCRKNGNETQNARLRRDLHISYHNCDVFSPSASTRAFS